jgi:hypothetical protein
MPLCEIRTISNQEMCRLRAFHAQGVALKYSWRSWSGVRRHDGVIVFAIAESDVESDDGGCRCLVWSYAAEARFGRQSSQERLAHCRLAVCRGSAEGILLPDRAQVVSYDTVALRVEKIDDQYWALWGSVTQSRRPARRATWFDASRLAS